MREYTKITPTRNSFWNHNIFSYLNAGSRSPLSYLFIPLVKLFATLFSIIHSTYFQQETQLLNSLKQLGPSKLRQKSPQQLQLLVQQSSGISIYVSDVQKWCWCLKMRSCNGREGYCHKKSSRLLTLFPSRDSEADASWCDCLCDGPFSCQGWPVAMTAKAVRIRGVNNFELFWRIVYNLFTN